jgi:hypothetical protein
MLEHFEGLAGRLIDVSASGQTETSQRACVRAPARSASPTIRERERKSRAIGNGKNQEPQGISGPVPFVPFVPSARRVDNEARAERLAIMEIDGDLPRSWAESASEVLARSAPEGVAASTWLRMIDSALWFAAEHGQRAERLGWTFEQVLMASPQEGGRQSVAKLLARGGEVAQVRADAIVVLVNGSRVSVRAPTTSPAR